MKKWINTDIDNNDRRYRWFIKNTDVAIFNVKT